MKRLRRAAPVLGVVLLVAGQVAAGAWPREEGTVFLSFGGNLALSDGAMRPVHRDPEIYMEYGLTPRITLGFSAYTADAGAVRVASSFVRVPLRLPENGDPVSLSIWYGTRISEELGEERVTRLGLHYGRPIEDGWIAVDAYQDWVSPTGVTEAKLDLTWGRRLWPRASLMLQLQTGEGRAGDRYAKAAPSLIWHAGDRLDLRVGLVHGLTGDEGTGLNAGIWLRF